jgi:hypothetical protein
MLCLAVMHRWHIALYFAIAAIAVVLALTPWNLPRPEPPGRVWFPIGIAIAATARGLYEVFRKRPDV